MNDISERSKYIHSTKEWLAQYFDANVTEIEQALEDELATNFLFIWPIFEQTFFGGFCKKENIEIFSKNYEKYFCYEEMFRHFYLRYQNKDCYRHLIHKNCYLKFEQILHKPQSNIADSEKLLFITFVVYRYRNNIFHGNKGIKSWSQFKQQIEYCIEFMTSMLDKRKHK